MLRFSDGMTIDTSGPLRIICESDGLYVTGGGTLCPVANREEGEALIAKLTKLREEKKPQP